jgi:hypothetical protein
MDNKDSTLNKPYRLNVAADKLAPLLCIQRDPEFETQPRDWVSYYSFVIFFSKYNTVVLTQLQEKGLPYFHFHKKGGCLNL